jgi:hypothetical protein
VELRIGAPLDLRDVSDPKAAAGRVEASVRSLS